MSLNLLKRLKSGLIYKGYLKVKKCIIACFRCFPICAEKVVFDNFGVVGMEMTQSILRSICDSRAKSLGLSG